MNSTPQVETREIDDADLDNVSGGVGVVGGVVGTVTGTVDGVVNVGGVLGTVDGVVNPVLGNVNTGAVTGLLGNV
jgi:hypothetical protein